MFLNEKMKSFQDVKVGVFQPTDRSVVLYEINDDLIQSLENEDVDSAQNHILGAMDFRLGTDYNEVDSVFAQKGWGPLTYMSTLLLTDKHLAPTRSKDMVTPAAAKIWQKMKPEYVSSIKIRPTHDDTVLNRAYKATNTLRRDVGEGLQNAINNHKKLLVKYGHGIKDPLFQASENALNQALDKIYAFENRILNAFLNEKRN